MENKKENKNGKMTLEKLARMVGDGFNETGDKIEKLDNKVDNLASEMSEVKRDVGRLKYQVDEVHDILKRFEEHDILNLQKRVQILEKAVRAIAKQMG